MIDYMVSTIPAGLSITPTLPLEVSDHKFVACIVNIPANPKQRVWKSRSVRIVQTTKNLLPDSMRSYCMPMEK